MITSDGIVTADSTIWFADGFSAAGGAQTLTPALHTNAQAFYPPAVSVVAVSISPSLYSNTPTFYAHVLNQVGGPLVIAPSLFSNTASFFAHTVTSGMVQLYPVRFDSASAFYAPTVSAGSFSGSISDADITRIVQAVLAALNATTIPVDTRKMNGESVIGDGSEAQPWRGVGVSP